MWQEILSDSVTLVAAERSVPHVRIAKRKSRSRFWSGLVAVPSCGEMYTLKSTYVGVRHTVTDIQRRLCQAQFLIEVRTASERVQDTLEYGSTELAVHAVSRLTLK